MGTSTASLKVRLLSSLFGIVCHALFVVGVGAMIAAMYFGMSRCAGRVPAPWSAMTNALLLLQFPILHSLLLTPAGGQFLRRLAPASLAAGMATTTYATVASIQTLALFTLWTPSGVIWWRAEGIVLGVTTALYAMAWGLLARAIWDAGLAQQTGFLGWWATFRGKPPVYPPMPTTGLFRLVRQPIYVAFALTVWTVPTWTPDQLIVALILTGYCLVGPLFKEARFRRRFGPKFAAYAARVPYVLPWSANRRALNDLAIYDTPDIWWSDGTRWIRALRNLVPARFAYFDPVVGDWTGRRVLDIGCGGGFMAEAMQGRGAAVSGIDLSAGAIAAARRHARSEGLDIDYRVASGTDLPFAAGTFDIAVCVDVLEHIADYDQVIAETRRVLRPGGLFLFDTINRNPLATVVMITLGEGVLRLLPRGTHDPAMFIRPPELQARLIAAGFEVGRFVGMGPVGIGPRLDFRFGLMRPTVVQYLGSARAPK